MKKILAKITCFVFIGAALAAAPAITRAAHAPKAPAAEAAAAPKKHSALPFHGQVAAVDAAAMTFTVGKTTIAISSTTKITKDGQPAVFADITVGATVKGSYKQAADGKLNASSVKIGEPKKKDAPPAAAQ
jgi:hypothetical protein